MRSFYDDNFGEYEINDQDDIEFYHHMQQVSKRKKCKGCKRWVKIHPDYIYCNACTTKLEMGGDL